MSKHPYRTDARSPRRSRMPHNADEWMIYVGAIGCGLVAILHTLRRAEAWGPSSTLGLLAIVLAAFAFLLGTRDGGGD